MNQKNLKILVAYDGSAYLGWQETGTGPSIEGEMQRTLEKILRHPVVLQAASRTDAGVHSMGQVVNFFTEKEIDDLHKLCYSMNSLLPKDIVVHEIQEAAESFHPTLDCIGKEYRYRICTGSVQMPQNRHYSWHFPYGLDLGSMQQAAKMLCGRHDFAAFCNIRKDLNYDDTVREVKEIRVDEKGVGQLSVTVKGDNFLYKMVRNLVGTLVFVGCGKIGLGEVSEILRSCDRTRSGITAPAHGLSLVQVDY